MISCHNRQCLQKNLRAFYGSVGDQRHCLPVRGAVDGGVPLDNDGLQIALQGILCGFIHEDDAVKPGIPVSIEMKESPWLILLTLFFQYPPRLKC